VIGAGEHLINGKKIDPKKAKARTGKVFVGGLIQEITDDDIKDYFSQFGNVSPSLLNARVYILLIYNI